MIKVLYIEGDCAEEITLDRFSAQVCLDLVVAGRPDPENYSIIDNEIYAGLHFVQIGEDTEGDTYKFIAHA